MILQVSKHTHANLAAVSFNAPLFLRYMEFMCELATFC